MAKRLDILLANNRYPVYLVEVAFDLVEELPQGRHDFIVVQLDDNRV